MGKKNNSGKRYLNINIHKDLFAADVNILTITRSSEDKTYNASSVIDSILSCLFGYGFLRSIS